MRHEPGAIEAFVTPSPRPAWARIGIGAVAEAAFLSYVLAFGRREVEAGRTADIDSRPTPCPSPPDPLLVLLILCNSA